MLRHRLTGIMLTPVIMMTRMRAEKEAEVRVVGVLGSGNA